MSAAARDDGEDANYRGIVLFLHGWAQNSKVMASKSESLTKKLSKHGYKCIFLQAPHKLPMKKKNIVVKKERDKDKEEEEEEEIEQQLEGRSNAYAWFFYGFGDGSTSSSSSSSSTIDPTDTSRSQTGEWIEYVGLEDSIQKISDILTSLSPPLPSTTTTSEPSSNHEIDNDNGCCYTNHRHVSYPPISILGFSQGAVFGHILASLASRNVEPFHRAIQKVILISGFPATPKQQQQQQQQQVLHDGSGSGSGSGSGGDGDGGDSSRPFTLFLSQHSSLITVPSLHVIGTKDIRVPPSSSQQLASYFANAKILQHDKGHIIPQQSAKCFEIIQFLNEA